MLALRLLPHAHPPLMDSHPLPVPQILLLTYLSCVPSAAVVDVCSATGMSREVVEHAVTALIEAGVVGSGWSH